MTKTYSLKVANTGKILNSDSQQGAGWVDVLTRAHRVTHFVCLCTQTGEGRLSVKFRKKYHLHRYAGSGPNHRRNCRFYSSDASSSGLQGYSVNAVTELEDGGLRVRLDLPLRQPRKTDAETKPASPRVAGAGVKRDAMSLLGLLHLLWSESGLIKWYPAMDGKRNDRLVARLMAEQAERINAARMTLNDVLLVPAADGSEEKDKNLQVVADARKHGRNVVAIAPLARYNPDRDAALKRLPLRSAAGMPMMYLGDIARAALNESFAAELNAWQAGAQIYAILHLSMRAGTNPYADVNKIGLMRVSERLIPLDSGHEATIEKLLYDNKRSFYKPLRFDAGLEAVFPDFWLLDMDRDYPMEVFGMSTPEYLTRKAVKVEHYNTNYPSGWWQWDAYATTTVPPLPMLVESA